MTTYATPAVRAVAERFGIDLATIEGTGVAGRIRLDDVWAHAPADAQAKRNSAKQRPASADLVPAPARRFNTPSIVRVVRSRINFGREVEIDEFSLNPLLDDFRQSCFPDVVQAVMKFDPNVPQMFTGGAVPLFTAGGFDPQLLLRLPWIVRHHAATTEKAAAVADIFERCGSGDEDAVANAHLLGTGHNGLETYRRRFNAWIDSRTYPTQAEPQMKVTADSWRATMSADDRTKLDGWKI